MNTAETCAAAMVVIACVSDVTSSRIPNAITFAGAVLALAFHALAASGSGAPHAAAGFVAGLATLFPIFALGAMGAGDVKLMAATGAWLGWKAILFVALYASLAGGVLAIIVALHSGYLATALRNVRSLVTYWWVSGVRPLPALTLESRNSARLPYALAIAGGLAVTLWRR